MTYFPFLNKIDKAYVMYLVAVVVRTAILATLHLHKDHHLLTSHTCKRGVLWQNFRGVPRLTWLTGGPLKPLPQNAPFYMCVMAPQCCLRSFVPSPLISFMRHRIIFCIEEMRGQYKWRQQIFREMFLKCSMVQSRTIKGKNLQ